jgi:hypothetical protein
MDSGGTGTIDHRLVERVEKVVDFCSSGYWIRLLHQFDSFESLEDAATFLVGHENALGFISRPIETAS